MSLNIVCVGRSPFVPVALRKAPFTLADAYRYGITEDHLRGSAWRRLGRRVFAWHGIAEEPLVKLEAAMHRLPSDAVFSGRTAAWLHGLDVAPCSPIEVTVPISGRVTRLVGLSVRRCVEFDRSIAKSLPVTSRVQTVTDLGRRAELIESVVTLDMALHMRLVSLSELTQWADAHHRVRGIACLRRAITLAEPATESPMETRLRVILVLTGLPRPQVQVSLRDASGLFLARPDLYYPDRRLAIEYDGATHRASLAADNRRQNRLVDAGYRILRFSASDVLNAPASVVAIVRRVLDASGDVPR